MHNKGHAVTEQPTGGVLPGSSHALHLAEMLCARLCHDLSGIIGALESSVEFLLGAVPDAEALPLARDAAGELKARIRLLRTAWGPGEAPLPLPLVKVLARGIPAYRRLSIDWAALPPSCEFSPGFGKVALNLLILSGEALPNGGTIRVLGSNDDLIVQIIGERAAWPPGFGACIAEPARAGGALTDLRRLQMPLTVMMAQAAGVRLSLLMAAGPSGPVPAVRLGGA